MKRIIIASDRQLPIGLFAEGELYVKRGIHQPSKITLPFHVEIDNYHTFTSIVHYIQEVTKQYKVWSIEVYSEDDQLIHNLLDHHPTGIKLRQLIQITYPKQL